MYISKLIIKNFRCFDGSGKVINLKRGLNVLVGENDSGKTAIIDAIRIILGTTDQNHYRFDITDFYGENQDLEISIMCEFSDLTLDESAAFMECLTINNNKVKLNLNYTYKYVKKPQLHLVSDVSSGIACDGPAPSSLARDLLRVTYLRPLRDSYLNMQSGRGSRLSQILYNVADLNEGVKEYSDGIDLAELSITGIADLSNKLLKNHQKLKNVIDEINETLDKKLLLNGDSVSTSFEVSNSNIDENRQLSSILEKLDLIAANENNAGRVGLGTSNILSIACELLLNKTSTTKFLLIEEPEAHIHAQRQLRLMQSIEEEIKKTNQQVIITTHSPLLASVIDLHNVIIVRKSNAYSLGSEYTLLDVDDYYYLQKYLDATKANLFFSKSVIIVEGPSEELLLPTIAKILGKDLTVNGVSIVNARGISYNRFAGIFKRKNESETIGIKVACLTDRDILPNCAPAICIDKNYHTIDDFPENRKWRIEDEINNIDDYIKEKRKIEGQNVKVFISNKWTLEYDLAYYGLFDELLEAIVKVKDYSDSEEQMKIIKDKINKYSTQEEKCAFLYSFFNSVSKPDVAQELAKILEQNYLFEDNTSFAKKLPSYIVQAINYVVGDGND